MARIAVSLLAALLLAPAPVAAQPRAEPQREPVAIRAEGTDLFRAFLDRSGINPIRQREMFNLGRMDDVIVIILGPPDGRPQDANMLDYARWVMENGGAVLVATDTPLQLGNRQRWDAQRGLVNIAQVAEGRVWCRDENAVLNVATEQNPAGEALPSCPFVVPLVPANAPDRSGPVGKVFAGLTRVATNQPAYLRMGWYEREFRHPLAGFHRSKDRDKDSYLTDDEGFGRQHLPDDAVFAVGGFGPDNQLFSQYRYLAMADHSVFINQMLITPGVQNLELTYRVIDFLSEPTFDDRGGKRVRTNRRSRCLFVENGWVVDRFDGLRQAFAPQRPPFPPINPGALQTAMVDFGNALADHVQTNDLLNRTLLRGVRFSSLLRFLLILLAVCATWFLLRRMVAYRKPTDVPPPPAVAGVPAGPPGVFDRRQKELIRRNNLYEPVRDLLREFFASVGVHGEPGPKPPGIEVSDAVRRPDSLRQAVRDFWKLAYGKPQEVTMSRWRELEPYFDKLRQAYADGKWHLIHDAEAAGV